MTATTPAACRHVDDEEEGGRTGSSGCGEGGLAGCISSWMTSTSPFSPDAWDAVGGCFSDGAWLSGPRALGLRTMVPQRGQRLVAGLGRLVRLKAGCNHMNAKALSTIDIRTLGLRPLLALVMLFNPYEDSP